MRPAISIPNVRNGRPADAVRLRNRVKAEAVSEQCADLKDLGASEDRVAVVFAVAPGRAALVGAVRHVVDLCSNEQVIRIAARRVIAAVAHKQAIDHEVGEKSGHAMSKNVDVLPVSLSVKREDAVPVFVQRSAPGPAYIGIADRDVAPKISFLSRRDYHDSASYHHHSLHKTPSPGAIGRTRTRASSRAGRSRADHERACRSPHQKKGKAAEK